MKNIIEIAHLVNYLNRVDVANKDKAAAVKDAVADGAITAEEGIDLIVEYTR